MTKILQSIILVFFLVYVAFIIPNKYLWVPVLCTYPLGKLSNTNIGEEGRGFKNY